MKSTKTYTNEQILEMVKSSTSLACFLRNIGIRAYGGNYDTWRKKLQELNADTSHWTGSGWNKNMQIKDWSQLSNMEQIRKNLILERGHKCEECGLTEWMHKPLRLEMHHRDGDRTNNDKSNLILLCPNCHSQTENYRNHKTKKAVKCCKSCGKEIKYGKEYCAECVRKVRKDVKPHDVSRCKEEINLCYEKGMPIMQIAKKFNTTYQTIHRIVRYR